MGLLDPPGEPSTHYSSEPAVPAAASRYRPRMGSSDDLAADLGVDEGDVRVPLRQLGEQTPEMPDELVAFVRDLLDPHGERTAPVGLYWPGGDEEPRRRFGLGGPDPTA